MLSSMPLLKDGHTSLYFEVHGEGPPLLLIAGLGSDVRSWRTVLDLFAARFKVIVLDNRGCGRTVTRGSFTIGEMADDCSRLLDHLRLSSAHVLGHSMGGFIALDLACRYPGRVDKLVLAATALSPSSQELAVFSELASHFNTECDREAFLRGIFSIIFSPQLLADENLAGEMLQAALNDPWKQKPEDLKRQLDSVRQFDIHDRIGSIASSTLVLAAENDCAFMPNECRELAARIPNSLFRIIDGAPHSIHVEKPAVFVQIVMDFLGEGGPVVQSFPLR